MFKSSKTLKTGVPEQPEVTVNYIIDDDNVTYVPLQNIKIALDNLAIYIAVDMLTKPDQSISTVFARQINLQKEAVDKLELMIKSSTN
jgi:hypothetical protein